MLGDDQQAGADTRPNDTSRGADLRRRWPRRLSSEHLAEPRLQRLANRVLEDGGEALALELDLLRAVPAAREGREAASTLCAAASSIKGATARDIMHEGLYSTTTHATAVFGAGTRGAPFSSTSTSSGDNSNGILRRAEEALGLLRVQPELLARLGVAALEPIVGSCRCEERVRPTPFRKSAAELRPVRKSNFQGAPRHRRDP